MKFQRNALALNALEVGALRAINEAYLAGVFEVDQDVNPNLRRQMFDAAQAYGKDMLGNHRAYDQENILSAIAVLGIWDEYKLLEVLPELEASGALDAPTESPMPLNPALEVST